MKIIRTWKGWTTPKNASIYEDMLINEVFPAVKKKGVDGLEKVSISTQEKEEEVEFFWYSSSTPGRRLNCLLARIMRRHTYPIMPRRFYRDMIKLLNTLS